jgi:hypothetical protein
LLCIIIALIYRLVPAGTQDKGRTAHTNKRDLFCYADFKYNLQNICSLEKIIGIGIADAENNSG